MINNNNNNDNSLETQNNKLNENNPKNKIINSMCYCDIALNYKRDETVMMEPCEHLIHLECYNNLKEKICPFCKTKVDSLTRLNSYKKDPKLYQKCVDILSMTNIDNMMNISYENALLNIPEMLLTTIKLNVSDKFEHVIKLIGDTFRRCNIKIKVKGYEKIKPGPKVYIGNHTCNLDPLVMCYVLKTGFVSSSTIKNNPLTRKLVDLVPMFLVEIGKKKNSVEEMKKYIKKEGSLCIFPEGMYSHKSTISRFRTGAFNMGYPIYPIILKYKNYMSDMTLSDFILKVYSDNSEYIEFIILDPFYPPFNDDKIEAVRFKMAEVGDMMLARTSNRDMNNFKKKKNN